MIARFVRDAIAFFAKIARFPIFSNFTMRKDGTSNLDLDPSKADNFFSVYTLRESLF